MRVKEGFLTPMTTIMVVILRVKFQPKSQFWLVIAGARRFILWEKSVGPQMGRFLLAAGDGYASKSDF